ncbi:hypothetical protein PLICBS_008091 [Purpureocillium lilacinum]|uniref:uncharacterized protein n=1 Tax=Purpureocillium lilacinum TaxID=33203 RepID=UPI00208BCAB6|nr:hypothetical protein PLICBS_008091 [Purpureocillium lilacinum]
MRASLAAAWMTASCVFFGIPTTPYNQSGNSTVALHHLKHIVVDKRFAQHRDGSGLSLIPPTLREFATTFAEDLENILGIHTVVLEDAKSKPNGIFLTLGDADTYLDAAGRPTSEGYTLRVDELGITITGASPLGAWWGTRTVLQQAAIHEGALPMGTGIDAPGWSTRGMMLDCGRHFYPKEFLIEMCSYMSYFKQNTFHLHLMDDVGGVKKTDNLQGIYARLRLWSNGDAVKGLNNHPNESYTRRDFDEIQDKCAARGVAILPELESPAHAMPIVQWRPQIAYQGDVSQLNISHPDTVPTVQTIWKEFLPWFHSKVVSIGADEYRGPKDDYKKFVNIMDRFIREESGKSIRIWGTFPPQKGKPSNNEISPNVSIQHWAYSFDNPLNDYIKNNYSVVNSDEMFYIVLKTRYYSRTVNTSITFQGDPSTHGPWYPYIFSLKNATNNPPRDEPLVQGAIAPLWNDRGPSASVYSEAYYAWRDGIPALADKQWGGSLTKGQFVDVFPKLHQHIPGQNLERFIPSNGTTIFRYAFNKRRGNIVQDVSSNGFNAKTTCKSTNSSMIVTPNCTLTTPWGSKGRNYTLSLSLKVDELANPTNTTLIEGSDSTLMLTPNITLFAAGNYLRLNTTIPLKEWITLKIIGRGQRTFASLTSRLANSSGEEQEFLSWMQRDNRWVPMAIEAPIKEVKGWTGEMNGLSLTNEA